MNGEELSLKAFLAGEQELGQGFPHRQLPCSQVQASREDQRRLRVVPRGPVGPRYVEGAATGAQA